MNNALTTLVGEELEGRHKWDGSMTGVDGSIYGIPHSARRVVKFNPVDKSITHIGPDFGDDVDKWVRGAMTENGIMYCPSCCGRRGILKIDTNTDTVTELDADLFPERGDYLWTSCAAAHDGCIYFFPSNARRIMKLDTNNGDAMCSVGDDLGDEEDKYFGTVVGIDGCVYGMPYTPRRIPKYDPINGITSFVVLEGPDTDYSFNGNGVLGRDGCIYALDDDVGYPRVVQIDTINNSYVTVGRYKNDHGYEDAILGIDGCIYWPPLSGRCTLKYDPHTHLTSPVGDVFGRNYNQWGSGALAFDGVIYCIPQNANQVLSIDPLGEFSVTTKANMEDHPEEFGFLFQIVKELENSLLSLTNFDLAAIKFGEKKVLEVLEESMKPVNDYCKESNLYPFMIAADEESWSPLCAIYYLLRRDLSWVNVNNHFSSLEGKAPMNAKRKFNSP